MEKKPYNKGKPYRRRSREKTRPRSSKLQAAVLPRWPRYYRATVLPPVLPHVLPRATEGFTVVTTVVATVLPHRGTTAPITVLPCCLRAETGHGPCIPSFYSLAYK